MPAAPTKWWPANPEVGHEERKLLHRFALYGANQIRVVYGARGLLYRELLIGGLWVPEADCEVRLAADEAANEEQMLLDRAVTRLGHATRPVALSALTAEEMRIVRMSNKAYGLFRASQRVGQALATQATVAGPQGQPGAAPAAPSATP